MVIGLQHLGSREGREDKAGKAAVSLGLVQATGEPRVISLQCMEGLLGSGWVTEEKAGVICGVWEDLGISL